MTQRTEGSRPRQYAGTFYKVQLLLLVAKIATVSKLQNNQNLPVVGSTYTLNSV